MTGEFHRILKGVSLYRGVAAAELIGRNRDPVIAAARHELCYVARHVLRLSNGQIGMRLSGRDTTTVQHSIQVVDSMRQTCRRYDDEITALIRMMKDACALADSAVATARLVLVSSFDDRASEDRSLAVSLVAVDGILSNPELSDADARAAALHMLNRSGTLFSQGERA